MKLLREQPPFVERNDCLILEEKKLDFLSTEGNRQLLQYLLIKKKVSLNNVDSVQYLKVSSTSKSSKAEFDETDRCVVKLKRTIETVDKDVKNSEKEIQNLKSKVKQQLLTDSRITAKNTLKRQKMVEASLQKKLDQKFNLESILDEITNAESNKSVVKTYRTGLDELKSKLNDLSAENVDDVLNEITEVLADGDQLSQSISRNIQDDSLDMDELEEELKNLTQEESDLDLSKELKTSMTDEDKELLDALEKLEVHDLEPKIGGQGAKKMTEAQLS